MTFTHQRQERSIKVPANGRRTFAPKTSPTDPQCLRATLHAESVLTVQAGSPCISVTYAGEEGRRVHLNVGAGACVWLDAGLDLKMAESLVVSIAPQACVGLSESFLRAAPAQGYEVRFASEGTGYLTATWASDRANPALRIIGMAAADRADLSIRHSTGAIESLQLEHPDFARWLPGLDASLMQTVHAWNGDDSLPIGIDKNSDSAPPPRPAPPRPPANNLPDQAASTGPQAQDRWVRFRAALTARQWRRYAPVVFEANSLGVGVPERRVRLAPGQTLDYCGRRIAAWQLVNGYSIWRDDSGHYVDYWRPHLRSQDTWSHEGLVCLSDDESAVGSITHLEQCRAHMLAHTALQYGLTLVDRPALRLEIGGLALDGLTGCSSDGHTQQPHAIAAISLQEQTNNYRPVELQPSSMHPLTRIWRFRAPSAIPPGDLRVVSRSAKACDTAALPLTDDRMLGVALTACIVSDSQGSRALDLSHPAWKGLHPWETRRGMTMRWTDGMASLAQGVHKLSGGEKVELHVAAVGHYWVATDAMADHDEGAQ